MIHIGVDFASVNYYKDDLYNPTKIVEPYVDFEKMRANGNIWAMARVSKGIHIDLAMRGPHYSLDAIRDAGMYRTAYHVVEPWYSAEGQMSAFLVGLGGRDTDTEIELDCETAGQYSAAQITDVICKCINIAKSEFGYYPTIYTRASWWNEHTIADPLFSQCKLHIARYSGVLAHPWADADRYSWLKPRDWNDYWFWQWSADGNNKGKENGLCSDDADINRFYGTIEQFEDSLLTTPDEYPKKGYVISPQPGRFRQIIVRDPLSWKPEAIVGTLTHGSEVTILGEGEHVGTKFYYVGVWIPENMIKVIE